MEILQTRRMKILVISNLYPPHEIGGYEIRCRDVIERLRAAGHEIRVLTSQHHVEGRKQESQPHVSRRLRIHGMYGHPWLAIHNLRKLEQHNHLVLQEEIAQFQPELVHVWNMGGISKSLLLRLEAGKIPVVYDVSDHWIARSLKADVWLGWWNRPRHPMVKLFVQAAGKLLAQKVPVASWDQLKFSRMYFCSAFMRDLTASRGWPVSHASIIHCGIDTTAFAQKKNHQTFSRLMWVGRLAEDKDPQTAVRALAACSDKSLTLDLYGHGDAEYIKNLDSEIEQLGLRNRVKRLSATAAEMKQLYAQYDALLFTSNWGEPFALTPLEAMASGLPVITSLDGGQIELAKDNENSLIAEADNPSLYAKRIADLASSVSLRETISANGLSEVREKFDIAVITSQIEEFLLASLANDSNER